MPGELWQLSLSVPLSYTVINCYQATHYPVVREKTPCIPGWTFSLCPWRFFCRILDESKYQNLNSKSLSYMPQSLVCPNTGKNWWFLMHASFLGMVKFWMRSRKLYKKTFIVSDRVRERDTCASFAKGKISSATHWATSGSERTFFRTFGLTHWLTAKTTSIFTFLLQYFNICFETKHTW